MSNTPPLAPGVLQGSWIGGDVWLETRLFGIQWIDGDDVKASNHGHDLSLPSLREPISNGRLSFTISWK